MKRFYQLKITLNNYNFKNKKNLTVTFLRLYQIINWGPTLYKSNLTRTLNKKLNLVRYKSDGFASQRLIDKKMYGYKDPINFFSSIVYLLSRYIDIDYDLDKIKKVLKIIEFNNLKKLEEKDGFVESMSGPFFRSGKTNTWKDILNKNQITKIENKFGEAMKELGYL